MSDQLSSTTQLFGHNTIKDIETIERVQRRFTKKLPGLRNFSYDERLSRLRLHSLELRRLLTDLILLKCLLLRNFLCSTHAPKLEATNINCLRSIMPRV